MRQIQAGEVIEISGMKYSVKGTIVFRDDQGREWTEYCLNGGGECVWLSVDTGSGEYLLTDKSLSGNQYDRYLRELFMGGAEDSGKAWVVRKSGKVDVVPGESCRYYEVFDRAGKYVLSQEIWEDETEYSRGTLLEASQISICDKSPMPEVYKERHHHDHKKVLVVLASIVLIGILGIAAFLGMKLERYPLEAYLKQDSTFQYETTITGDTYSKEKANVYRTYLTVEEAKGRIGDACYKSIESMTGDENQETVGILTKDEYALIYKGENQRTYIQVSPRSFSYSNNNVLFMSLVGANHFYKSYYYQYGYDYDSHRYHKRHSRYTNFIPMKILYKEYKDYKEKKKDNGWNSTSGTGGWSGGSTRRSSSGTRRSGSGGISGGK